MGSQIPDPEIRLREVVLLSAGQQSEEAIRRAADRGDIETRRDAAGNRLFRFSSVVRWLQSFDTRKREAAAKDAARVHKEARRRHAKERRSRGKE